MEGEESDCCLISQSSVILFLIDVNRGLSLLLPRFRGFLEAALESPWYPSLAHSFSHSRSHSLPYLAIHDPNQQMGTMNYLAIDVFSL